MLNIVEKVLSLRCEKNYKTMKTATLKTLEQTDNVSPPRRLHYN